MFWRRVLSVVVLAPLVSPHRLSRRLAVPTPHLYHRPNDAS